MLFRSRNTRKDKRKSNFSCLSCVSWFMKSTLPRRDGVLSVYRTLVPLFSGGGAENRTPVQQGPIWQRYERSPCFDFRAEAPKDRILFPHSPLKSRSAIGRRYRDSSRLCDALLGSDDRAPKERGRLIKQPVRNLCWQLFFWSLIYEVTPASARSSKPSILPSKPVAPLSFRALQSYPLLPRSFMLLPISRSASLAAPAGDRKSVV